MGVYNKDSHYVGAFVSRLVAYELVVHLVADRLSAGLDHVLGYHIATTAGEQANQHHTLCGDHLKQSEL